MSTITTKGGTEIDDEDWGRRDAIHSIAAFPQIGFTEDRRAVALPVPAMHGADDQIVPYDESAPHAAALLPNAALRSCEGLPHGPRTTHPQIINQDPPAFVRG